QINVLVLRKVFDLFVQMIRFDADRAMNPLGADVVIAVTANVNDLNPVSFACGQTRSKFRDLHARDDVVSAVFAKLAHAVNCINHYGSQKQSFHHPAGSIEALQGGGQEVAAHISHKHINGRVEECPGGIQGEKLGETHLHASGERSRHGIEA